MSKLLFLAGSQFFLIWLEAWLGAGGWPLPLAVCGALYCALAFGPEFGAAGGVLAGMGRCVFAGSGWNLLCIGLYPVLAAGFGYYQSMHENRRGPALWLPGVLAGIAAGLPAIPGQLHLAQIFGSDALWSFGRLWLWSTVVTALIFPVILLFGEMLAEFLGLPRFLKSAPKGRRA